VVLGIIKNEDKFTEAELEELIPKLFFHLYRATYEYMTIRRIQGESVDNKWQIMYIKVASIVRVARMDINKPVYILVDNGEIEVNQFGKGVKRKIMKSGNHYKLSLTPYFKSMGLNVGDFVIVKVKKGLFRISNPIHEKQLLEAVTKEKLRPRFKYANVDNGGVSDAGEIDPMFDNIFKD